jgi:PAS domain S-box-containing protein
MPPLSRALLRTRIGTFEWNARTGKAFCSENLRHMLGFEPGLVESNPQAFAHMIHPEDREFVLQKIEACLREDLQPDIEFRIITPGRSVKWVAATAQALRNKRGQPIGLVGIAYDVTDRKQAAKLLAAQHAVTHVLAESETVGAAAAGVLRAIGENLDWDAGAMWVVDSESDSLRCFDVWGSAFGMLNQGLRWKRGIGLPGRIWESGEPAWVPDITKDTGCPRASAAEEQGLHAAFGFPLRLGSAPAGVMEFFSREIRPPDADLLRTFAAAGSHIGQAMGRIRAGERTAALLRLTTGLSEALTIQQVTGAILAHVPPAVGAYAAHVRVADEHGAELLNLRTPGYPESQAAIVIPLQRQDRAIGSIGLAFAREPAFGPGDRDFLQNIGQYCAQALERARRYDAGQAAGVASEIREAKFRRLVESNVIGVVYGQSETITGANEKFLNTVGYTFEDLLAGKLNWREMTPPELRHLEERARTETLQRRAFAPYEKELIRKDGSRVSVLAGGASLDNDASASWVSFVLDLTERKWMEEALRESEFRFRAIFDQAPLGIAGADLDGHLVLVNQKYCDLTGYSQEELLGKSVLDLTHPDDRQANEDLWKRAVAGQTSGYCLEKRYARKDGSNIWTRVTVSVISNQDGAPMYTLGIAEDISERKRIQEQLLNAQKLESLGVLAGGIAHDFNNLLTGILGNASLALEQIPDGVLRTLLDDVIRASQKASNLTRQMLAYAGRGRFIVKPIDLTALVRQALTLLKGTIPKGVLVQMDPAELPPIEGDPSQIQQIVRNLVMNAAEAIEGAANGIIRITTSLERLEHDYIAGIESGLYAALRVQDNGCGMDEATKSRIFDPFFTTKFTGRGLGLAAVSGIVRGHKGAIQVSSSKGVGTTFTVFLPVNEAS